MEIAPTLANRLAALHGAYERIIEALYTEILSPGAEAVDGGAHSGLHTIPMAYRVGRNGKVYAFEPLPHICAKLRKKVSPSAWVRLTKGRPRLPQVEIIEAALTDRDGSTIFYSVPSDPGLSSAFARGELARAETITVRCTTLDSYADRPIRFVKLDLESGEYHAIRGGLRLLDKQRPVVICEWGGHDAGRFAGYTATDYFGQLDAVGYATCDFFGHPIGVDDFHQPFGARADYIAAFPKEQGSLPSLLERATSRCLNQARPESSKRPLNLK
jgi:FkbM family methyltransferase